jgi:serine/threonine-protein kinase
LVAGGSSNRFLSEAHGRVGRWLRNKWHLDSLIAIGGMAAVYASTHRNGARAAIKLLHSQYTRNEQARRRFLAEGYAANKVGHRNAVLVLDDDTTEDGEVYLVMELLEGESLEGRLERLGVMGPMEVLAIADQLLEVLACAHPKGILHRDIKPANIYLTRDGSVKLLDFGLARVRELSAEALDQSDGIVFGTVSYIAPEQARADNQNLDSRSDMWSIAATMFRALAGETVHPSTGPIIERLLAVARKPARSIASLAPHLPRPVIELVDRALAFDPEDRWPSANVMRVVVQDVMAQLQEEAEGDEMEVKVQQQPASRRNNTLPVTTRAKTLDLPTVRPGLGPGAADPQVQRPKTDPVGLSTRPRNLPPTEPSPPDGDETELNLDGLYDKAKAAPKNPGRNRTLLTKEGRAELRRILDARRGATPGTTSEPEPAAEPHRGRGVAGPDASGVGDIDVEFEDSIIEVTIGHTQGSRSGPIAERISEPSTATPAPVAIERQQTPAAATTASAARMTSDEPEEGEDADAAPPSSASETYPAISVEEDDGDAEEEAIEEDVEAEVPATSAPNKPSSNLRPPSVPPHQPVASDSRVAPDSRSSTPIPSGGAARAPGRPLQGEITRVGPPPRPAPSSHDSRSTTSSPAASSESRPTASNESRPTTSNESRNESRPAASNESRNESRPAASNESRPAPIFGAREITKVGPAPVAPATPPAGESQRPSARPNAGLLHETMRGPAAPVAPPTRGTKDTPRPAGATGLLNETIRPGVAPPPAQARSGPIPVGRVESEPAKSTVFTAPVRPGSDAARPEASATVRATNFVPPPGRAPAAATPVAAAPTVATPAVATPTPAPAAATSPSGAPISSGPATLRLPSAAPRSPAATGQASASSANKTTSSDTGAPNKLASSDAGAPSKAVSSDTATTSKVASTSPTTSKAPASDVSAPGKVPTASDTTTGKAAPIPAAGKAPASEGNVPGPDPTAKNSMSQAPAASKGPAGPASTATAASNASAASNATTPSDAKAASNATATSKAPAASDAKTASNANATSKAPAASDAKTASNATATSKAPAASDAKTASNADAASKATTSNIAGVKPAASTTTPTIGVTTPAGSSVMVPVVPAASAITVPVVPVVPAASAITVPVVPATSPITVPVVPAVAGPISVPVVPSRAPVAAPVVAPTTATPAAASNPSPPISAAPPEAPAAPEPAPVRGKSMFNPYPSLAGSARSEGSATAKTASYATVPAAVPRDNAVVSPNPRTSPNAKTAPHAAAGAAVPKDSSPAPQDSSQNSRTSGPTAKTAAYSTVSAEDARPSEPSRSPGEARAKTGAVPVLPFNFLRGGAKPAEPSAPPEDPDRPGRKKP